MNKKKLNELTLIEESLEEELRNVRNEKRALYNEPLNKIDLNKIYRIGYWRERDYETDYVGFITDYWFSKNEGRYIVDLCVLSYDTSEYCDNAYSTFFGLSQREISPDNIKEFVDSLEEMTEEELKSYIREWLVESEKSINEWFSYFKNKNYDEDDE